ncbi:hypothetical protein [Holophaga foetida]|uniref:hypothetical protein n=1 Tax=Holophaga foetida TaxID=35839 RepID=UPI0002473B54|nr:hypothetical protein [Holophaga foetida]
MAISNAARRQGEAASTLPREQVIECLAELEERASRFLEIPEVLYALDRIRDIRGHATCPESIEKVVDDFDRFDVPMFLEFIADGIQHRLINFHAAQESVRKDLGITHEEILTIRHEIRRER